jgi:hypothetical protein
MADNIKVSLDIDTIKALLKLTETKNLNSFASFMNVSELISLEKLNDTLSKKITDNKEVLGIIETPTKIV